MACAVTPGAVVRVRRHAMAVGAARSEEHRPVGTKTAYFALRHVSAPMACAVTFGAVVRERRHTNEVGAASPKVCSVRGVPAYFALAHGLTAFLAAHLEERACTGVL